MLNIQISTFLELLFLAFSKKTVFHEIWCRLTFLFPKHIVLFLFKILRRKPYFNLKSKKSNFFNQKFSRHRFRFFHKVSKHYVFWNLYSLIKELYPLLWEALIKWKIQNASNTTSLTPLNKLFCFLMFSIFSIFSFGF